LEVLRTGVYQLVFLDKVPAAAAVNEAVKIARRVSSKGATGFVNGCLRSLSRALCGTGEAPGDDPRRAVPLGDGTVRLFDRPVLPDPARSPAEYLAAAHNLPPWLVRRWLRRHDEATCRRLCEAANLPPRVVLRVNRLRTTQEELVRELAATGRWARPVGPDHVALEHPGRVGDLEALRDGRCTVQGVAASAAAPLLKPQPGERLLDVCSAPGSKACQLAELAANQATVVAVDISPGRLHQVVGNARRLGVRTVVPVAADGRACHRLFAAAFDGALVDVPCSNTGVLARRVEARWRASEKGIRELAELQRQLLESAARVVRPNGRLAYSTCSLEPEENQGLIECFAQAHPDWRTVSEETFLPLSAGQDGGYVAFLVRNG
ncbi:MAG: transcription antitermination factor NusB, partial [Planctomycetota bacterium]